MPPLHTKCLQLPGQIRPNHPDRRPETIPWAHISAPFLCRPYIAESLQLLHSLPDGRVYHLQCQAREDGNLISDLLAFLYAKIWRYAAGDVVEQARRRRDLCTLAWRPHET